MQENDYKELVEKRRTWYKNLGSIYCPCLQANVRFNAKGFYHLLHDGKGVPRTKSESLRRLTLVLNVPLILETARSISWNQIIAKTTYVVITKQVIIGQDEHCRIRVVIIKTSSGNFFYHSVIDESGK